MFFFSSKAHTRDTLINPSTASGMLSGEGSALQHHSPVEKRQLQAGDNQLLSPDLWCLGTCDCIAAQSAMKW